MERVCEHCQFYAAIGPGSGVCRKDEVVRHEVAASFGCGDFQRKVVDDGGCYCEEEVYS